MPFSKYTILIFALSILNTSGMSEDIGHKTTIPLRSFLGAGKLNDIIHKDQRRYLKFFWCWYSYFFSINVNAWFWASKISDKKYQPNYWLGSAIVLFNCIFFNLQS